MPLVLGGVRVESPRGLAGHSDGDVIAHALIDAILGAANLGDIGSLFPSDGRTPPGVSSLVLLEQAYARVREAGLGARQRRLRLHRRRSRGWPRSATTCAPRSPVRCRSTPTASRCGPRRPTGSASRAAARGSLRRPSRCFVGPRQRGAQRILQPIECQVELLGRVVEMLLHPGDRPPQRRERRGHVPVAQLRHLEQRRPSVVRVGPPLDLSSRLQPSQVRRERRGGHPEQRRRLVGVIGWNARIALWTAKSFGFSFNRIIAVSSRSLASWPRMKSRNRTLRLRGCVELISCDLAL